VTYLQTYLRSPLRFYIYRVSFTSINLWGSFPPCPFDWGFGGGLRRFWVDDCLEDMNRNIIKLFWAVLCMLQSCAVTWTRVDKKWFRFWAEVYLRKIFAAEMIYYASSGTPNSNRSHCLYYLFFQTASDYFDLQMTQSQLKWSDAVLFTVIWSLGHTRNDDSIAKQALRSLRRMPQRKTAMSENTSWKKRYEGINEDSRFQSSDTAAEWKRME